MNPLIYFSVASKQVAKNPISILKIEVTQAAGITDGLFFQVHDSIVVPAEGSFPVKSWPAAECAFKDFKIGELNLTLGCYVCLSTTAATKTLAVGGSDLMSILQVEVSTSERPSSSATSIIGDLVTPVSTLQIWSQAVGLSARQSLLSIELSRSGGNAEAWMMVFASDTVSAGDKPVESFHIPLNKDFSLNGGFYFGESGRLIESFDGTTRKYGCSIFMSSTPVIYTADSHQYYIRSKFRIAP
jgi:hypothetical protein